MGEIVKVDFSDGKYEERIYEGLIQWDIGTKLEIHGLELSGDTQVHFSLEEYCGLAKRMLGVWKDGVLTVEVPAFILEDDDSACYCYNGEYHAFAWLYVTDNDTAKTIKKMELHIEKRAKPDDYSSPGDKDIIQKLQDGIEEAVNKYLDENPVQAGIPTGGKAGQYLRKTSDKDYEVEWADFEIPEQYGLITYDQDKRITIT